VQPASSITRRIDEIKVERRFRRELNDIANRAQ
jgi:hypothetical protein